MFFVFSLYKFLKQYLRFSKVLSLFRIWIRTWFSQIFELDRDPNTVIYIYSRTSKSKYFFICRVLLDNPKLDVAQWSAHQAAVAVCEGLNPNKLCIQPNTVNAEWILRVQNCEKLLGVPTVICVFIALWKFFIKTVDEKVVWTKNVEKKQSLTKREKARLRLLCRDRDRGNERDSVTRFATPLIFGFYQKLYFAPYTGAVHADTKGCKLCRGLSLTLKEQSNKIKYLSVLTYPIAL